MLAGGNSEFSMQRQQKPKPRAKARTAKVQPEKAKRGRPCKYKPEFVDQARALAELGATDREVADFFKVNEATLNRWKLTYPDLCASLKVGKEHADDRVEQSLYRRAIGYTFDSEKVFQHQGVIVRATIVEHVPPDTTAAIFWLKNRRAAEWRDKQHLEHSGTIATRDITADMTAKEAAEIYRNELG